LFRDLLALLVLDPSSLSLLPLVTGATLTVELQRPCDLLQILLYFASLLRNYVKSSSSQLDCLFTLEESAIADVVVANCLVKVRATCCFGATERLKSARNVICSNFIVVSVFETSIKLRRGVDPRLPRWLLTPTRFLVNVFAIF